MLRTIFVKLHSARQKLSTYFCDLGWQIMESFLFYTCPCSEVDIHSPCFPMGNRLLTGWFLQV